MQFVFVISCIILLLGITLSASRFSNHRCDNANWWESLDRETWSVCPETKTYLRGFWRSAFQPGDERVGRLEEGRCCDAVLPQYAGQPATCSDVDLSDRLNRQNVWALCPPGYFMNGLRLGFAPPAFLNNIDEAKCCRPQNHPSDDGDCYEEDVTISFDKEGWSECQRDGFYMNGFYKSRCDQLNCIEKLRCCKMKTVQICEEADWQASLDQIGWSMCPRNTTFLRGLWRHDPMPGDNRVGRVEFGKCCTAEEPPFINQSSTCLNADWSLLSNRYNVWALCPSGYFMNGLRLGYAPPAFLNNIAEAKCCHPQNHPSSYGDCYDENVTISFSRRGWSECQRDGFYMTGFYKSNCDELYCIEKFRCCKMKNEPSTTPQNVKGTSISSSSISVTGNEVPPVPSNSGLSSGIENSGKTEPPREPSAAPQNVKGMIISSTSILITWDEVPSADRNGFILTHTITYRLATESHNASVTVKATEFQKELTGLKEHANYSITVFSTNQIGDGPASKPIFVTTSQYNKDEQTSGVLFQFTWASVGAFAVLVCVVLIVIATKRIRRKRKDSLVEERNDAYNVSMLEITPDIMNQLRDHSERNPIETQVEAPNSGADDIAVVDNETYLDQVEIDRNWEIPRERLEILETELGGGEFGVVKKGNYLRGDGNKLPVAVKMLKDDKDQKQRMVLIQELEILRKVGRHKNIVSLVGAFSFEEPLCVIIEFVPGGSLDQILLESRIPARTEDADYANLWSRLSERNLLRIAKDVANGMQHLESKLCVHRDLAARNILIGEGLTAKVADFGLSRDISEDGEYIKCTEGRVPWLWMSMESLKGINTTMSDVWSFGVVLWEIVTLGERPYYGVTGIVELYTMLQEGVRLKKPPHCSKIMYDIMLQCWERTPEDRPTFKDLHSNLHTILCESAVSYINITHFEERINEMDEAGTLNCII